jgi:Na+-driven multidrug efflux pump
VADRGSAAVLWLAVMLVPAAIAFAYDGVLIGAGDYRFLGRAALGYTLTLLPVAAIVLARPQLGIAGIWLGITLWMCLRAIVNHLRARRLLAV